METPAALELQKRMEAVLDEAIQFGLLESAARPWILKWLMVALSDESLEGLTNA